MHFIIGTKLEEDKLGFVADFCPLCRDLRAFSLVRVRSAAHVNFVSMGRSQLAGHLMRCRVCNTSLVTELERYLDIESRLVDDLPALIEKTFPEINEYYEDRLAVEASLLSPPHSLPQEVRAGLLLEPFRLLNPAVVDRYAKRGITDDRRSSLGCAATLVVTGVLLYLGVGLEGDQRVQMMLAMFLAQLIGALYTLIEHLRAPYRFLRRHVIPVLASALQPLEPTLEEIRACLKVCKNEKLKIGRKIKSKDLWRAIKKPAGLKARSY